jgi:hypothetical protein
MAIKTKGPKRNRCRFDPDKSSGAMFIAVDGRRVLRRSGTMYIAVRPGWSATLDKLGKTHVYYNEQFIGIAEIAPH